METISLSDNKNFTVDSSTKVTIYSEMGISNIGLPIEITADFKNIPPHLHEMFLTTMIYQYHNQYVVSPKKNVDIIDNRNWLQRLWQKITN